MTVVAAGTTVLIFFATDLSAGLTKNVNFLFSIFFKKFFREVILCTILYDPWKLDPDGFSHIGDHRQQMTGWYNASDEWPK